jgi:hypothetical protein
MLVSKFADSIHSKPTVQMPMEFLEYKSNAWGQKVLEGVSWDLIWVFVVAGLLVVAIHVGYVAWRKSVAAKHGSNTPSEEQVDG